MSEIRKGALRDRTGVRTGGERLSAEVVTHTLEIEPSERRVTLIWAGRARTGSQQRIQLLGLEAERDVFEDVVAEVDGREVVRASGCGDAGD